MEDGNMSDASIATNQSSDEWLPVICKRRERRKEDIELSDFKSSIAEARVSPFLCGTTIGAQVNRILTDYSIAMLIVTGNHRHCGLMQDIGTGSFACYIATNQIHVQRNVSDMYRKKYEHWVVNAVSNMIDRILSIPSPCVLFTNTNTTANLWFDMTLDDGTTKKLTRIYLVCEETGGTGVVNNFQLVLDTTVHDNGNW